MDQERILQIIKGFGLSDSDFDVYFLLSKKGPRIGRELSKELNRNKKQIYRSLKELQSKSLVTATLENSKRFQAVPFEQVIDLFVKSRIEQAKQLQKDKKGVVRMT
jgi:predicted transcriptional regulator